MAKYMTNSLGYRVLPPNEDEFHRFKDDKEKQEFIKKHELDKNVLKKNAGKWFCKDRTMPEKGALVEVVGYSEHNKHRGVVMEFSDGSLHTMLPAYFKDMQRTAFKLSFGVDSD